MEILYGLHAVEEALRAGRRRFDHVIVARERSDDRLERVVAACRAAGVRVRSESRDQLTQMAKTAAHQGVVALVHAQAFLALEDLFEPNPDGAARLVLALDGVEDPQNLGALLRVADGAGVDGVLWTERRAAPLSSTAAKNAVVPASARSPSHLLGAEGSGLALGKLRRSDL